MELANNEDNRYCSVTVDMFEKFMMVTNTLIASGVWATLIYIVSSK